MNIQKICVAQFNIMPLTSRANSQNQQFGIRMAKPVCCDSVSFQGKVPKMSVKDMAALARKEARALRDARQIAEAKKAPDKTAPTKKNLSGEERKQGVSKSTAKQIREKVLRPQKQIDNFMEKSFGDLVASEYEPKKPILKMSGRAKSVISIMEKSATRDWNSVDEILKNMTDLNGRKFVFNYKTGKSDIEAVLDRFILLIKMKQIKLIEIELQRPEAIKNLSRKELSRKDLEEFDYVSKAFLDKLEDAQEEVINGLETDVDKITLIDRPLPKYTKFNYCALHLLMQLEEKGSRPFEIQIMGARENAGKILDDKRFKFFDEKELDKMYAPLVSYWERLMPEENASAKERFLQYCKDANLQLREDEIQEYKTQRLINRSTGLFKSVRNYNLTPEYDLNEQYKLMLRCEHETIPAESEEKKNCIQKAEEKVSAVEKRVVVTAKEKIDSTKEKLQKLVAKYSPKRIKNSGEKEKSKN